VASPLTELPDIIQTTHLVGVLRTSDQTVRSLHNNTQHSQQTDMHALSGIRTPNPNKRPYQTND
jgi:hypothetical protein